MTRAFVVGNGYSLAETNLDRLSGEVSFACNRIKLIYPQTTWRPTHYVRAEGFELFNEPDPSLWAEDLLYHIYHTGIEVWCNLYFKKNLERAGYDVDFSKVHILSPCSHYTKHYDSVDAPHLWHLPKLCSFGSTVNVMVQIAATLGYNPIYLIGCDLGYQDGKPSHFTSDYEKGYGDMLRSARYANLDTLIAHVVAKRSNQVEIYNATIGGSLEVYERVNYDTLFCGGERGKST